MKISEKQLLRLLDIAKGSCEIPDNVGGYELPLRIQLVNEIIDQQSDEPKDVDSES